MVDEAIARFDAALPGLATMRNVGEHIDAALPAAQQLFLAVRDAHDRHAANTGCTPI